MTFEKRFEKTRDRLAQHIWDANAYFYLHCECVKGIAKYELNRLSPSFWSYTIRSQIGTSLERLCHIYDTDPNSISLVNWLSLIEKNKDLFSAIAGKREVDFHLLDQDRKRIYASDPIVNKLIKLRGNVLAHTNADGVLNDIDWYKKISINYGEIEGLINLAFEVLDRYSVLFDGTTHVKQPSGIDDFKMTLKACKSMVEEYDKKITAPSFNG